MNERETAFVKEVAIALEEVHSKGMSEGEETLFHRIESLQVMVAAFLGLCGTDITTEEK